MVLVQLAVVRSQLVPFTPFQASRLGVEVIWTSIEWLPVLLTRVAPTPGGGDNWKLAMLASAVPVYLIRVNVPAVRPDPLMLMTMLEPGAEMPPATLMAGAVGLAVSEP